MFDPKTVGPSDLRGGRLHEIVGAALAAAAQGFDPAARELASLGDEVLDAFEIAFGWRPPREVGEYLVAQTALAEATRDDEVWPEELGGWLFGLALCDLSAEARQTARYFDWAHEDPLADPMLLLLGLVQLGGDASGDTCFVSVLPHPDQSAEVWVFDHEVGEISHHLGYSITDALLSAWLDEDDEPSYFALAEKELGGDWERGRARFELADALWPRCSWLVSLLRGDPGWGFEGRLGDAPTFAQWTDERSAAAAHPHLAIYWMFAHYFFGNDTACREAVAASRQSSGEIVRTLAEMVEHALDDPSAGFGHIPADRLAEFRALVHANADPGQLDPESRKALQDERGAGTADPDAVEAMLAEGSSPLEVIAAFPDDVELHDAMLDRLAAEDDELAEQVAEYRRERTRESYNEWPWGFEAPDERLSIPVSAAFRSGLRFGESHKRAFAGITRTLGRFDDDHAIAAYRAAIETLARDDDRLEFVIDQLTTSSHPAAHEVLVRGALRFFENLEELAQTKAARAKEWPSLDDMFRVDDYLIHALIEAMRVEDVSDPGRRAAAEVLARKTLQRGGALSTLGVAWARAMQVVARLELDDLVYLAQGYVEAFRDTVDHQHATWLRDEVILNLAESARTLALLAPEVARPLLRSLFEADYADPAYHADVVGALLAGMLVLEPTSPDVLQWTERILGSRCEVRPRRLYGALVGVATARLAAARDWVWPHVYAGYSGIHEARSIIGDAAVAALGALGVDESEIPAFDDEDWYATGLSTEDDLLTALDQPHLHGTESVFERLREQGLASPAIAQRVGDWFVESLRFAEDDHDRHSDRDRREALRVLLAQGDDALPQIERILALPHLGARWRDEITPGGPDH